MAVAMAMPEAEFMPIFTSPSTTCYKIAPNTALPMSCALNIHTVPGHCNSDFLACSIFFFSRNAYDVQCQV